MWVCEGEVVDVGGEGEYTHSHTRTMYLHTSKIGLCL